MMPEKVPLTGDQAKRLHLYAGFLDPANGLSRDSDIINALKFASLFYDRIIVPDGFFHAYSPLSSHLRKIASADEAAQSRDAVVALLRAGILVPALRVGGSLYDNWVDGANVGIVPGHLLTIKEGQAEDALRLADRMKAAYALWPDPMAKANIADFGETIHEVFREDGQSSYAIKLSEIPNGLPAGYQAEWNDALEFAARFLTMVEDNRSNPKFRRGDIEGFIAQHLGLPFVDKDGRYHIYDMVRDSVAWQNPTKTLKQDLAFFILNVASSVYEAYQANQFNAVASLFQTHDDGLVDEGLYNRLVNLEALKLPIRREPVLFGSLDVSALSVEDIIRFRDEPSGIAPAYSNFAYYSKLAMNASAPSAGTTFTEANSELVGFLERNYVPRIIKKYPQAGFAKVVGFGIAAGHAPNLVEIISKTNWWAVMVSSYPVVTYVSAGGIAIAGASWATRELFKYIHQKWQGSAFNRKNRYYWSQGR